MISILERNFDLILIPIIIIEFNKNNTWMAIKEERMNEWMSEWMNQMKNNNKLNITCCMRDVLDDNKKWEVNERRKIYYYFPLEINHNHFQNITIWVHVAVWDRQV